MPASDGRDVRVRAALAVLAGEDVPAVAARLDLDARLVARWTEQFTRAGAAAVRNEPVGDEVLARDRLLAAIDHELRTPLMKVRTITALLQREGLDAATTADLHRQLRAEFQHLDQLLRRLDETTGASLGRLLLDRQPVTAAELLDHLDVPVDVTGDGRVDVDVTRMRTVVDDLVELARSGPATEAVRVRASVDGAWCEITVHRTGDPFDPTRLAAVLDPFAAREDHSDVTFGLHLAMALTVLHGGQLGVRRVDDRDVLWVRVPVQPPHGRGNVVPLGR